MTKTKNRFLALLLVVVLLLAAIGCGSNAKMESVDLFDTANWMQEAVPEPYMGSVGGEWLVFGLARSGADVPDGYMDGYYDRLVSYVQGCDGVLHERKYTEYSRVILALTAIGKDPADVGGYNLLVPLADYEQTIFQGINGPVFALLALDSGAYEIPPIKGTGIQADRKMYVDYILEQELAEGGWSLAGTEPEADMTAMVLQALAKYQDRKDVQAATERALKVLSDLQNDNGGYSAYGAESCESTAQVIVALAELGIDPNEKDYVKNEISLMDNLQGFKTESGAFRHLMDGKEDLMATEQAFYAMVAYNRMAEGIDTLYVMSN